MKHMLTSAEAFARGAHAGQKHGDRPYWTHLRDVAELIPQWGFTSIHLECAAWLHDTIEDTKVTYQDIRELFGCNIAGIVWAVTDEMGRNRKERKEKTYPKIFSLSQPTILKLADLYDNVSKSIKCRDRHLDMYVKEWPETRRAFLDGIHDHGLPLIHVIEELNGMIKEVADEQRTEG